LVRKFFVFRVDSCFMGGCSLVIRGIFVG